jgi:hypothetical protein
MVYFFFYNYLTNIDIIKKVNSFYIIHNAYTYIHSFDKSKNNLILLELSNDLSSENIKLPGLLVYFEMSLESVLNRLAKIDEIKYKDRNRYKLDTIIVTLENSTLQKCYIIY